MELKEFLAKLFFVAFAMKERIASHTFLENHNNHYVKTTWCDIIIIREFWSLYGKERETCFD